MGVLDYRLRSSRQEIFSRQTLPASLPFVAMEERFVVIMAGGSGERFWPQSRLRRPKHLLPIVGDSPMLRQTVERLKGLVPPENVFVITNCEQREAVLECCPELLPERVVGEPVGRDTAAAVGLAAILVRRENAKSVFAILPADHVIADAEGFRSVLDASFQAAGSEDLLVTIGIQPDEPATGYGYLHRGELHAECKDRPVYKVSRFVEKPDLDTARGYLQSGEYLWNAGMFVWRPEVILGSIAEHSPELFVGLEELESKWSDSGSLAEAMECTYPSLQKISIDFAVMEKAQNVALLESDFDWDDVGEWPAIARHFPSDDSGNVFRGEGIALDSTGNVTFAEDGHLVALLGVDDLIVVQSGDATLVCRKDMAQRIKEVTGKVSELPGSEGKT